MASISLSIAQRVCELKWTALAAVLVLTVCCPQQGAAATIIVNTTRQGVIADPKQCSLQEAIYAAELLYSSRP